MPQSNAILYFPTHPVPGCRRRNVLIHHKYIISIFQSIWQPIVVFRVITLINHNSHFLWNYIATSISPRAHNIRSAYIVVGNFVPCPMPPHIYTIFYVIIKLYLLYTSITIKLKLTVTNVVVGHCAETLVDAVVNVARTAYQKKWTFGWLKSSKHVY